MIAAIFDGGRRETRFFTALAVLLVLIRAAAFTLSDADQLRFRSGHRRADGQAPQRVSNVSALLLRTELPARRAVVDHRAVFLDRPAVRHGDEDSAGAAQRRGRSDPDAPDARVGPSAAARHRICRRAPVHRADAAHRQQFPRHARQLWCRAVACTFSVLWIVARPSVRVWRAAGVRLSASRVHDVRDSRTPADPRGRRVIVDKGRSPMDRTGDFGIRHDVGGPRLCAAACGRVIAPASGADGGQTAVFSGGRACRSDSLRGGRRSPGACRRDPDGACGAFIAELRDRRLAGCGVDRSGDADLHPAATGLDMEAKRQGIGGRLWRLPRAHRLLHPRSLHAHLQPRAGPASAHPLHQSRIVAADRPLRRPDGNRTVGSSEIRRGPDFRRLGDREPRGQRARHRETYMFTPTPIPSNFDYSLVGRCRNRWYITPDSTIQLLSYWGLFGMDNGGNNIRPNHICNKKK